MANNDLDVFGTFSKEDARTTNEEMTTSANWIKFEKGIPLPLRILPPLQGEPLPWVLIHQHFIKMPGNKTLTFNCPQQMKNQRCPACEKMNRLKETGNSNDEALAKDFKPGSRAIARAIDRDHPERGVRPVGLSSTVMKRLTHFREKLNKDFTHPHKGYDVIVENLGVAPWYQVDLADSSPIAETPEGLAEVIQQMRNLSLASFAKVLTYDEILGKFSGDQGPAQAVHGGPSRAALGSSVSTVDSSDDPF